MKRVTLSILLVAGAALAGAASAQDAPPPAAAGFTMPPAQQEVRPQIWNGDTRLPGVDAAKPMRAAFNALEARNFVRAEEVFADYVRRDRGNVEANFYLGAVRMDLGKWAEAKKPLQIAAKNMRRHPDPKSRLGVTYAMLGDIAGAHAQRAKLVKMANACNGTCKLAPHIAKGIQMIDEALAQSTTP